MSVNYVIPGVSKHQIIQFLEQNDDIIILYEKDYWAISTHIDTKYALRKRMALGRFANAPPDDIQQGGNKSHVNLADVPDDENAWFWCNSVSLNHPEWLLDYIVDNMPSQFELTYIPDTVDEYFDYMDDDDDDDEIL